MGIPIVEVMFAVVRGGKAIAESWNRGGMGSAEVGLSMSRRRKLDRRQARL